MKYKRLVLPVGSFIIIKSLPSSSIQLSIAGWLDMSVREVFRISWGDSVTEKGRLTFRLSDVASVNKRRSDYAVIVLKFPVFTLKKDGSIRLK